MSHSSLQKSVVLKPLNLTSIDDLNLALIELGEALKAEGKEVPEEFHNPENYQDINKEHLQLLRDFTKQVLNPSALPPASLTEEQANTEAGAITSTAPTQPVSITPTTEFSPQVLLGARETLVQLYGHLSELEGIEAADVAWDAFDEAFSERNEVRFQAALGAVTNELEATFNRLQQRSNSRKERREATLGKFHQVSDSALGRAKELMVSARLLTAYTAQEK